MPGWRDYLPELIGGNPRNYGNDEKADTPECAKYSNKAVRKFGIKAVGHAWNRYPDLGYKSQTIIDGFDYTKDLRPSEFNKSKYKTYLANSADSLAKYIDYSKLKTGDIVSMYYNGSPNAERAFKEGKVAPSTHTGHIVVEDNIPYLYHNVGGTIVKNKAEDVSGSGHNWGMTQIRRFTKK